MFSLSLFDPQYNVLLDVLGVLFDVILFCGVFAGIRWIVGLWSNYPSILFESFPNSYMHDHYSFVFLFGLLIWFGQLDCFILQWERCFAMSSILRCSIPVTEGDMTRIFIVSTMGKMMGFIYIDWVYFVCIMSCSLRHYSVLYELNTLDACWIAVDVLSNSTRCRQESVYLSRTWCIYTWSFPWISS